MPTNQKLAMVVDPSRCIDCKACMASCKVANNVPEGFWRNWIKVGEPDFAAAKSPRTFFQPGGCMHCDKPTCVTACPTGATYKDEATGEVKIDEKLCIGCGNCIPACPYGARFRNPLQKVAEKCNYCPERRANGLLPACVDTCPTKVRVFGDLNDPDSEASRLLAANKGRAQRIVNPKSDTEPNMYYIAETKPENWPHEAKIRTPMKAMMGALTPGLSALVGLSGLGVLVMLGKQLVSGSSEHDGEEK